MGIDRIDLEIYIYHYIIIYYNGDTNGIFIFIEVPVVSSWDVFLYHVLGKKMASSQSLPPNQHDSLLGSSSHKGWNMIKLTATNIGLKMLSF